ncbi:MAG: hypothetical protein LBT51_09455 [Fusobacteriaceae bacterium]|jgi:hypothetical protein|nr:hypothetical protein [Fusobacteriaceae bacterium]
MNLFVESNFKLLEPILIIILGLTIISFLSQYAEKFYSFIIFSLFLYIINKNETIIFLIIIIMWIGVLIKIFNTDGFSAKYSQMVEWYTWPLWLMIITIIISMTIGANISYKFFVEKNENRNIVVILTTIFMFGIFSFIAFKGILTFIKYGLCRLISVKNEKKHAILRKIWKEKIGRRSYEYYVLFEDDPYPYRIKKSLFNNIEGKSGMLFSYTKYYSILDIKYIKKLHEERISSGNA